VSRLDGGVCLGLPPHLLSAQLAAADVVCNGEQPAYQRALGIEATLSFDEPQKDLLQQILARRLFVHYTMDITQQALSVPVIQTVKGNCVP
jgi:hypothetical protein